MEKLKTELQQTKDELSRVIKNRSSFYEIMSDMVFLIVDDYHIEHMNRSAIQTFGDLRGQICYKALYKRKSPCEADCPLKITQAGETCEKLIEKQIGDKFVEFSFVPFHGYQGDTLVLKVMRDITARKRREFEIAEYNNNIERVLRQKIKDLKESVKVRENLSHEITYLQKEVDRLYNPDEMIGESKSIRNIRETIYQVADTNTTVLITGESGTGKELIADLIYKHSDRKNKPYLKFNCAAVPEGLLESDLFGYEKGSFTGAATTRKGKFEIADGGTIFLDEIGDISPKMQASLLRVLQNGEIIRVGGTTPLKIDVRIIAATNAHLAEAVATNKFRNDLYYRLNVINLHLSELKDRKEDIILLATYFIKKYRAAFNKDIDYIPNRIIDILLNYEWPGNVRELENVIQRAVLLTKERTITEKDLGLSNTTGKIISNNSDSLMLDNGKIYDQPLKKSLAEYEAQIIAGALDKYEGKVQEVARLLSVGKTALYSKIKKYSINE